MIKLYLSSKVKTETPPIDFVPFSEVIIPFTFPFCTEIAVGVSAVLEYQRQQLSDKIRIKINNKLIFLYKM